MDASLLRRRSLSGDWCEGYQLAGMRESLAGRLGRAEICSAPRRQPLQTERTPYVPRGGALVYGTGADLD
jgi:hypothetical protein